MMTQTTRYATAAKGVKKLLLGATEAPRRALTPAPAAIPETLMARSCGLTDTGRKRESNEDCFAVDDGYEIYTVADGIASGGRGELASRLAVETVRDSIMRGAGSRWAHGHRLATAIGDAHTRIYDAMVQDVSLLGMGTTVVSLLLNRAGREAVICHVGDSRAYRLRDGRLELLTRDHTMAAQLVANGEMSPEVAADHPFSHVLTRALSFDEKPEVETRACSLQAGDLFLLCSDGLTNMVSDRDIEVYLENGGGLEARCRRLVGAALRGGGRDNITVVMVEIY